MLDLSNLRGPVAVTGAGGFIGRRVVQRLLEQAHGIEVRALLLPSERLPPAWPTGGDRGSRLHVVRGDVTDATTLAWLEGAGTLIHLAAVVTDWAPWDDFRKVTVEGTRKVLGQLRPRTRVVLASSIAVYGHRLGRRRCAEDRRLGRPRGRYSRSKKQQEQLARRIARAHELRLTVVRPANVFGLGSRPWVQMVLPLLERHEFTLIGGGDHDAGLCHVDNLADLLVRAAASSDAVGRTYNAADGEGVTWRRYFGDLAEAIGAPPPRSLPRIAARPLARLCELVWQLRGEVYRPPITREAVQLAARGLDIPTDRAREELGWVPRVSYEEAIAELRESLTARDPQTSPSDRAL